ncbi:MAG: MBOAT family O-acyltransferase [Bacteroidota bacterium]
MQNGLILLVSYCFYGWWSWKFLGLLVLSTLLDYCYGFGVAAHNKRKAKLFLWLSILNNLGILFIFKYYNFFIEQFQICCTLIGVNIDPLVLNIIIPIGISFYTFHGMSYVFDIYRGVQKPVKSIIDYGVFVSFFPLLVAGPIERANHLLPQVQKERKFDYTQARDGCRLILWGMFKKVVIADSLAVIVNNIFENYEHQDAMVLMLGAVAFSFQIYGDFSGYSDIALGTAKLMGFELLSNFKFPYFSRDIAEFWRRWHISLSSWFRDYLYIPIGGSQNGKAKAILNIWIVFLVSGFWHGASWNFIVWGCIHAVGFIPLFIIGSNRKHVAEIVGFNKKVPGIREVWQMLATFTFVTVAWIFFRAKSLQAAMDYITRIVKNTAENPGQFLHFPAKGNLAFVFIAPLICIDWWLRNNERQLRMPDNIIVRYLLYLIFIIVTYLFLGETATSFIYFQF